MATFKRLLSRSVVNTPTPIGAYTATTQTTIIGLTIANTYSVTIKVDVALFDGTNTTYIVKGADVPVGGSIVIVGGDQKVVMMANDQIRINSDNAAHTCDALMSLLEI